MSEEEKGSFELDLKELEEITRRLEGGDLSLEDAIGKFEQGTLLARRLKETLQQAEGKILKLTAEEKLEDFIREDDPPA